LGVKFSYKIGSSLSSSTEAANPVSNFENFETLEELLKELGLDKYYPLFQQRGVEINQFAGLTDQDLKDLVRVLSCHDG
jgi:predicted transcriptional regulator